MPGKGTTSIQHATDKHHLEPLKLPDASTEDLGEGGGEWSAPSNTPGLPEHVKCPGLACSAVETQESGGATLVANTQMEVTEPADADTQESGGVLLAMSAQPAPTEDTTGIELIGAAEKATAAEPEALEPWTEGMAR
jgi:hypothetical protein